MNPDCSLVVVYQDPVADHILARLPIFPLPGTVLFPGVVMPLHVFEPRYQALIERTLAADGCLVLSLAKGIDGLPMQSRPTGPTPAVWAPPNQPVHTAGCVARIVHADRHADGRYDLLLRGLHRVVPTSKPSPEDNFTGGFLYAAWEAIPAPSDADIASLEASLAQITSCVMNLSAAVGSTDAPLAEVLHATADPIALIDILAAVLITDPHTQQQILASSKLGPRIKPLIQATAAAMIDVGTPSEGAVGN